MCIIIDNCVSHAVFCGTPTKDHAALLDWLHLRDGSLVYGGKLAAELLGSARVTKAIATLKRAGRAVLIPDEEIGGAMEALPDHVSDDPHVLALALVSGARVLCTSDADLIKDFLNKKIIDKPRGSVYKYKKHAAKVLVHTTGCRKIRRGAL